MEQTLLMVVEGLKVVSNSQKVLNMERMMEEGMAFLVGGNTLVSIDKDSKEEVPLVVYHKHMEG